MPRAAPAGRGVGVSRSFDPSTMGRGGGGGLQPRRSVSPSNRRPPPPSRGVARGRSMSPSRMQGGRGRSNSPSQHRGRPEPNRRGLAPSRSFDPSMMGNNNRGRSNSPSLHRGRPPPRGRGVAPSRSMSPSRMARGRSSSPSRGISRARSMSPSRMAAAMSQPPSRGRSQSPSRNMRGRSQSPSRHGARGRSSSPSRNMRGRSSSPSQHNSKGGRGRRMPKFKSFRRNRNRGSGSGGGGGGGGSGSVPAYNDPNRRGAFRGRKLGKSLKRIAPKESCDLKKVCCYAVPVLLMLVSAAGLITATGNAGKVVPDGIQDRIADLIPTFNNEDLEDPFSSASGTAIPKWNNNGGSGLEVTVVDALDDSWQVAFSLAIADWDFGNPDALILTSEKIDHDIECAPIEGKIKVCNGDYGNVPWRGINQAEVDAGGFIIASAARMNDFYLKLDTDDARQYTMCHEVGHAFGLPHTDEEFDNEDLGNCLDYTNNWDVNKHPSAINYAYLIDLYGPAGGRRRMRRHLRQIAQRNQSSTKTPHGIRAKMSAAVEELLAEEAHPERHARIAEKGWKLLHHVPNHGEEHELEVGEGYKVRVQLLLAPEKEATP